MVIRGSINYFLNFAKNLREFAKNIKTQQNRYVIRTDLQKRLVIMAAIPGWAYIVIGVLMSAFSKLVEAKTEPGTFKLFFWIGILFILIGVGKYIFKRNKKEPLAHHQLQQHPQQSQQPHLQQRQQQHQQLHPQQQHQGAYQPQQSPAETNFSQGQHHVNRVAQQQAFTQLDQHPSIIACSACGTRHYDYARYCMQCGTKIRRR